MTYIAYPAKIWEDEDKVYQVEFPDLPSVITYGETLEEAKQNGREALTGILSSMLDRNRPIHRPSNLSGKNIYLVTPDASVATPILLRWAREDEDLTLEQLAQRVGVSYQSLQRLERPGANPSIKTLAKVAKGLGRELQLSL